MNIFDLIESFDRESVASFEDSLMTCKNEFESFHDPKTKITQLIWSIMKFRFHVADFLARHVNIDRQDSKGWTALHYAASYNQPAPVQYLLSHGAKIEILNNKGQKPEDLTDKTKIKDEDKQWITYEDTTNKMAMGGQDVRELLRNEKVWRLKHMKFRG